MSATNNQELITVPGVIYIMGIDGSGKSTVSEYIADQLRHRGYDVDILWLRFNHVLSKPLLAVCRLLGLTKYETIDGIRVGYHNFYKSKIISKLFIFFQYLDAVRVKYQKILFRLKSKNKVIILDRYVYDILIDIAVDVDNMDFLKSNTADKFISLIPDDSIIILVRRDLQAVLDVRPEGVVDRNFESRYMLFETLVNDERINVIENSTTLDELKSKVSDLTGLN